MKKVNFSQLGNVVFPKPTGIDIYQMPFIMGDTNSISKEYKQYLPIIEACKLPKKFLGKVGYLTIKETNLNVGQNQKKAGIHVDLGYGNVFIANNMAGTCRVFDKRITNPENDGNCEKLRHELGEGISIEPNRVYHLFDTTPHESLPVITDGVRQFFRLITGPLDKWYVNSSTENSLGVVPPKTCRIIDTTIRSACW